MTKSDALLAAVTACALAASPARAADPREVTLPRGTSITLRTVTPLDSDRAAKGKPIQAAVLDAVYVNGRLVVPKDAVVSGRVRDVRTRRTGARSASIALQFDTVEFPGRAHPIAGVLTSVEPEDRRKILAQEGRLGAGRKVDVVLVGTEAEAGRKPRVHVGARSERGEEAAEEWAASALGAPVVALPRGTVVAMRLEKPLALPIVSGAPGPGDRNILVGADDVRRAQQSLKARGVYAGEASGVLDDATRRAIASYQIEVGQPATGDLDEATARHLAPAGG